jgi:hypothetical protein
MNNISCFNFKKDVNLIDKHNPDYYDFDVHSQIKSNQSVGGESSDQVTPGVYFVREPNGLHTEAFPHGNDGNNSPEKRLVGKYINSLNVCKSALNIL